jgi:hypothetical protein
MGVDAKTAYAKLRELDDAIFRMLRLLPEEYGDKGMALREAICDLFRDEIAELEEAEKPFLTKEMELFNNFRAWRSQ